MLAIKYVILSFKVIDPCLLCSRYGACKGGGRKQDCLAPYPNLRAIGNSPGGFRAAHPLAYLSWSAAEIQFYNSQVRARPDVWPFFPDIL